MKKYKPRAFKRTILWYLKRKIDCERCFQSLPYNHISWINLFFCEKSSWILSFPKMWFYGKLWKYRSQSILRFRYHEIVRLKALDLYFSKMKKLYILPQCPFVYVTVEDIKILKNCYFELHQKISFLNASRNQRGLRQDYKFFNFSKIWIKTFQTHYLSCILGTWLLRYLHLKFCALGFFFP